MKLGNKAVRTDFLFKFFKDNIIHFLTTLKICRKQQYIDSENH